VTHGFRGFHPGAPSFVAFEPVVGRTSWWGTCGRGSDQTPSDHHTSNNAHFLGFQCLPGVSWAGDQVFDTQAFGGR
jgi:hypothetical protein